MRNRRAGVSVDSDFVYVMGPTSPTVHRFSKQDGTSVVEYLPSGEEKEPITLSGANNFGSATYGGLVVAAGEIYRAAASHVYRYSLETGEYSGVNFGTSVNQGSMAFNGRDICVASNTWSLTALRCFRVLHSNVFEQEAETNGIVLPSLEMYHYSNRTGGDVGGSGTVFYEHLMPTPASELPQYHTRLYLDN